MKIFMEEQCSTLLVCELHLTVLSHTKSVCYKISFFPFPIKIVR